MSQPLPLRPPEGTNPGPPLLGPSPSALVPLPHAAHAQRVTHLWKPLHDYREGIAGEREPYFEGYPRRAYRPQFSLGWDHLPKAEAFALATMLLTPGPLYFAPYSLNGAPLPYVFEVNLLSDVPDFDDLTTAHRPISLAMDGVKVWPIGGPCYGLIRIDPDGGRVYHLGPVPGLVTITYESINAALYYGDQIIFITPNIITGLGSTTWYYPASDNRPHFVRYVAPFPSYTVSCPVPAPVPPPPAVPVLACGETFALTGPAITQRDFELGPAGGWVRVDYNMLTHPDMIELEYEGEPVARTNGFVSGSGFLEWLYPAAPGRSTVLRVRVLTMDSRVGSNWTFTVHCPVAP